MRKQVLIAAAVLALGGTGILVAYGQPAPPPAPPGPGMADRAGGWREHMMMRRMGGGGSDPSTFALVYPADDRKLTEADVQKIAEAFLLRRGNHTWKITNVAPAGDHLIGFSISTPEGSVIAKFTMDQKTAKMTRTG